MSNLSRRNFLKGAALGALGMTAMSAGVALAEDKAAIAWDAEADIVVVGTGTAVTAAIAANEFGAEKIIVLEKDEAIFGGTSASSGHGYALPGYLKTFEGEGIEDVNSANIALYPNPATTTVTLTGIDGQATVTIVDMNGRKNGEWRVENGELTIDLTGYAQGAYFVRITGEQVNAIRKLIVK